ncbi:MAG: anthranilate synthase component I [Acidobacteria bacterium]|nr:anthranilate synthase component I [Acidobacteriota bacterium]MCH8985808.1 anthranilate synthase component I [Acidobacteriota bacterium]
MKVDISREVFLELARTYNVVPVSVEILGDRETPVSVFERLVGGADGFLLESVEGGERWARWSFVGWNPEFTLTSIGGVTTADGPGATVEGSAFADADPLSALELATEAYRTPPGELLGWGDEIPPLFAGAVGYLAYDIVRYIEHLPNRPPDDRGLPELMFQFVGSMAIVDRFRQTIRLVRNVFIDSDPTSQYDAAVADLDTMVDQLGEAAPYRVLSRPAFVDQGQPRCNIDQSTFEDAVRTATAHIVKGDAFQIVPSLRLEVDFTGDAFDVYRALRLLNPSPYLFFLRFGGLAIAGSSPELMTRTRNGKVYSRPIAGTRPRGASQEEDAALAEELITDPKERAEHVMLIDLARNDVGRVSEFGSVTVDDLMVIERYSHVMHLVSGVSGTLRKDVGPIDVLRATFPHGTVTGAPKVRAMEIIDELEPVARGPYAGAVGYIDFSGNVDTAIALRTLVIADGKAWVQAGAGIVADSDPTSEYEECMNKAAAALAAVAAADKV